MQPVRKLSLLRVALISAMVVLAAPAKAAENEFVHIPRADSPGNDYRKLDDSSIEDCERKCAADGACNAFTYNQLQGACFLKLAANPIIKFYALATTGVKLAPSLAPAGSAPGTRTSMVMLSQADSPGGDYAVDDDSSLEDCQASCEQNEECNAFTYNHARGVCFLKRAAQSSTTFSAWATTGIKLARQTPNATTAAPAGAPAQPEIEAPTEQPPSSPPTTPD
jgi:hypothetical protein